MASFTIGADPEFVLIDSGGAVKSAVNYRFIPPKENPTYLRHGGVLYYDNALVEFQIPAVRSVGGGADLSSMFRAALKDVLEIINPCKLLAQAATYFPEKELEHPENRIVGCVPELSAWDIRDGRPVAVPAVVFNDNLRTCGGHIHIGAQIALETPAEFVRILDLLIGVTSILINPDPSNKIRQKYYGKAGRFRYTPYGIEYRTVSNYWFASPWLVSIIDSLVSIAVSEGRNIAVPADVRSTIDTQDYGHAMIIWQGILQKMLPGSVSGPISRLFTKTPAKPLAEAWDIRLGKYGAASNF